jgi:hypothetical protein
VPNASVSLALSGAESAGWDGVLVDGVFVDGVLVDGVLVLGLWPSPCSAAIASAPARITKAIAAINLMTHLTDRPHQASGYQTWSRHISYTQVHSSPNVGTPNVPTELPRTFCCSMTIKHKIKHNSHDN